MRSIAVRSRFGRQCPPGFRRSSWRGGTCHLAVEFITKERQSTRPGAKQRHQSLIARRKVPFVASVKFTVNRDLNLPARAVFDELVDWRGHAKWVPLTKVKVLKGDGGPGTEFIATSGIGPLALPDRMLVDALDADAMTVRVSKIGPVLTGVVHLSVTATGEGASRLDWVEDILVPHMPQFLAKPVAAAARMGFQASISRMAKLLAAA